MIKIKGFSICTPCPIVKNGKHVHDVIYSDIGGMSEEEKHDYVKRIVKELPDMEEIKEQIDSNPDDKFVIDSLPSSDDGTEKDTVFSNPPEKRGPLKNYTI